MMAFAAIVLLATALIERWALVHGLFGAHYVYNLSRWPGPIAGTFPVLVPFLWLAILIPSFLAAERIVPAHSPRWARTLVLAVIGGCLMAAWDLVMDPVAVALGFWSWNGGTPFWFGVPLENYAAWVLGGSALQLILRALGLRPELKSAFFKRAESCAPGP